MYAYYNPPTFQMSAKEALLNESNKDYALQWCASAIVHDAYHSKKFHDYQEAHGHSPSHAYPPIDVWTGVAVERECIAFQKKVCGEIGAYQTKSVMVDTVTHHGTGSSFTSFSDNFDCLVTLYGTDYVNLSCTRELMEFGVNGVCCRYLRRLTARLSGTHRVKLIDVKRALFAAEHGS
jgi:hypothetical protein